MFEQRSGRMTYANINSNQCHMQCSISKCCVNPNLLLPWFTRCSCAAVGLVMPLYKLGCTPWFHLTATLLCHPTGTLLYVVQHSYLIYSCLYPCMLNIIVIHWVTKNYGRNELIPRMRSPKERFVYVTIINNIFTT